MKREAKSFSISAKFSFLNIFCANRPDFRENVYFYFYFFIFFYYRWYIFSENFLEYLKMNIFLNSMINGDHRASFCTLYLTHTEHLLRPNIKNIGGKVFITCI